MKLVEVTWRDILQDGSWSTQDAVDCPVVKTVGWLAHQDKKTLKIGNCLDDKGQVCGITAMPMGCVLSCRTIED